jgi:hypothetical protein
VCGRDYVRSRIRENPRDNAVETTALRPSIEGSREISARNNSRADQLGVTDGVSAGGKFKFPPCDSSRMLLFDWFGSYTNRGGILERLANDL